jgi:hypothetical protein
MTGKRRATRSQDVPSGTSADPIAFDTSRAWLQGAAARHRERARQWTEQAGDRADDEAKELRERAQVALFTAHEIERQLKGLA